VYFVSDRGGSPQIYRMPIGGGNADRVTFTGGYNISPCVSPDGRMLAYVARDNASAFRVMALELGGGTPVAVTDTTDDESPSFAPNGRLLMYASRAQGRDVLMTTTSMARSAHALLVHRHRRARAGLGSLHQLTFSGRAGDLHPRPQGADHDACLPHPRAHRCRRHVALLAGCASNVKLDEPAVESRDASRWRPPAPRRAGGSRRRHLQRGPAGGHRPRANAAPAWAASSTSTSTASS
jgi:hypothetical protein